MPEVHTVIIIIFLLIVILRHVWAEDGWQTYRPYAKMAAFKLFFRIFVSKTRNEVFDAVAAIVAKALYSCGDRGERLKFIPVC